MKRSPCILNHPCPRRKPGCHGKCRDFKIWRNELDEFNAKVSKIKEEEKRQQEASFKRTTRYQRKYKKG